MRAGDELALDLLVVGGRVREPAFERMAFVAGERVASSCAALVSRRGRFWMIIEFFCSVEWGTSNRKTSPLSRR